MTNSTDVVAAQDRARDAREQLFETLSEVKTRLAPGNIAHNAMESAAESAVSIARNGAEAVRARPVLVGAVVGAIGLFLARRPIGRLIGLGGKSDATPAEKASLKPKRARRASKGRQS